MALQFSDQVLALYAVEDQKYLKDIDSDSALLRHKKTGARIALLPAKDDNKVFYIAFRTPPTDSTGVAHIVEHTVLCGSRDFPVKDPFIELVKGSLNTFLNAMTYPDKTVYPVASCNDEDFKNLMNVYLNAVFYPNLYKEENIFRQEGWHYETENAESPITVNGVVYNEMKGALSSAEDTLMNGIFAALYPHTAYANESGGNPEVIPDLTYEAYLDFHRRYYHPSNSYIYLYGDMDMEERLLFIDSAYLSDFDRLEIDSRPGIEAAFDKPVASQCRYSILNEEEEEGKSFLSWNVCLAPGLLDLETGTAFKVLDYVLGEAEGAVLRKALRDRGIGEDVDTMLELGVQQPCYSVISKYTDAERGKEFAGVIEETLRRAAEEGIDERALLAGINYYEFRYREANFGSYPKGLVYGLGALDTWLYDDTAPFVGLEAGDVFSSLRDKIKSGYFEQLIRDYLLDNPHKALVTLVPEKGLTEKKAAAQREKLEKYAKSLTAEERAAIAEELDALHRYQQAPEDPEDLKKIPMLSRSDLGTRVRPYCNAVSEVSYRTKDKEERKFTIVKHPLNTSGIVYAAFLFDITRLPEKYLPYLGIFKTLLGVLDTEHYTYAQLDQEINILTGGIGSSISTYNRYDGSKDYRMMFEVSGKAIAANTAEIFKLTKEILLHTKWDSIDRIREVLEEERAGLRAELPAAGHMTAAVRATAGISETSALMDRVSGVESFRKLDEVCGALSGARSEEAGRALVAILQAMAKEIFRGEAFMADYIAAEEMAGDIAGRFADFAGELNPGASEGEPFNIVTSPQREGFTTAGQVQYVCRAGSYTNKGLVYTGALRVLRVILGYDYLWNRVRVHGGAYGCMSSFARDGSCYMVSYRDPHLKQTIDAFEGAAGFVRSFDADERTLTQKIIGAVSALDHPMTPPVYGKYSLAGYLTGQTEEDLQRERDEVLQADPETIRGLAVYLDALMEGGCFCTVGTDEKIRKYAALFDRIEKLC